MTTTGFLVWNLPPGDDLDTALGLVRIGLRFREQQCGRRTDAFTRYVVGLVAELPKPTFAGLLERLDLEASRRAAYGEHASPVEKVDRVWQLLTIHCPRRGRIQITFSTLRNKLTSAKNKAIPR